MDSDLTVTLPTDTPDWSLQSGQFISPAPTNGWMPSISTWTPQTLVIAPSFQEKCEAVLASLLSLVDNTDGVLLRLNADVDHESVEVFDEGDERVVVDIPAEDKLTFAQVVEQLYSEFCVVRGKHFK